MYYTNHYVIDWKKVHSYRDLKRIMKAMHISFEPYAAPQELIDDGVLVMIEKDIGQTTIGENL